MRLARSVATACLIGSLFPLANIPNACAAEGPSAVLVVDAEDAGGESRYCVALPSSSVSGLELIELAHEQHGLDYRLGYGGNVVCVLAGVGYESDECLKDGPEFWGYWRGDGNGGWEWSSTGGNSTRVEDGDVEGWSWGTGNDGSNHPQPPRTTFAAVCGEPVEPSEPESEEKNEPKAEGRNRKVDRKAAGVSAARPNSRDPGGRSKVADNRGNEGARHGSKGRKGSRASGITAGGTLTPAATSTSLASEPTSATGDGPPLAGLLAATVAVILLIAGAFLQRRRLRSL